MAQTTLSPLETTGSPSRTQTVNSPPGGRGNPTRTTTRASTGQGRRSTVQGGARNRPSVDAATSPAKRTASAAETQKVDSPPRGRSKSTGTTTRSSTGQGRTGSVQGGARNPRSGDAATSPAKTSPAKRTGSAGGIRKVGTVGGPKAGHIRHLAAPGLTGLAGFVGGVVLDRWNHSHSRRAIVGPSRPSPERWIRNAVKSALQRVSRVRRSLGR